ncbi:MAG: DUF309 domain-containing protein [Deltaproteobacteria bacterium]|nr:DUF309 domain-containing protein [Deltaproteobacteria bacterium]
MKQQQFNPFEDRQSRNIRNDLSESLLEVLETHSTIPAQRVAEKYLKEKLSPVYSAYIKDRLDRYDRALQALPSEKANSLIKASILWDLKLFFEVHEILEPEWIDAQGDRKLFLQALIRAAGVYLYLELGYRDRAEKISHKAIPILRQFKNDLMKYLEANRLISALEDLPDIPPRISKI